MSISSIRLGVVGAGRWGANLIRSCSELGVLQIVCDTAPTALDRVEATYPGVATTTDVDWLLKSPIHGVVVASPAHLHASLARRAIASGKHVFVEKPLALTVADAEKVVSDAERAGVVCFIGHVLLYHPAVRRLLELVRGEAIGRVVHARSRRMGLGRLREHESVWWSFAPHDVALVLELFGEPPTRVTGAQHRASEHPLADFAYADARFGGGGSAHIEVSWLDPGKCSRFDVFGTRGVLSFDDGSAGGTLTLTRCAVEARPGGGRAIRGEPPESILVSEGEPLRYELEAFLSAIATGEPTLSGGRAALEVVRVLAALDACAPALEEVSVAL
ncbi:Gfo/Idh/MocA family oxidoreductase [bacterium]|nr:MAG: Gfo/Idh/MocA family oxidoreductase [bacterium]